MGNISASNKVAIVCAILGFVISFHSTSTSSINGVVSCSYTNFSAIIFGGIAVLAGGLGEFGGMANRENRSLNLAIGGGAALIGIFHLLRGFGVVGGPCN